MLQVVVQGDGRGEPGGPDATKQGIVLAVIPHEVDRPERWILGSEPLENLPGVIPAAVVDDDDFVRRAQAQEDRRKPPHQLGQSQRAIVCRNDDRGAGGELGHRSVKQSLVVVFKECQSTVLAVNPN